jgi:hypothetical protein
MRYDEEILHIALRRQQQQLISSSAVLVLFTVCTDVGSRTVVYHWWQNLALLLPQDCKKNIAHWLFMRIWCCNIHRVAQLRSRAHTSYGTTAWNKASGVGEQYNMSRGAYTVRLHQCTPQVSHTQLTVPTLLRRRCEGGTAHNSNTEVYTSQQELTALNRISAHI